MDGDLTKGDRHLASRPLPCKGAAQRDALLMASSALWPIPHAGGGAGPQLQAELPGVSQGVGQGWPVGGEDQGTGRQAPAGKAEGPGPPGVCARLYR